MDFFFVAVSWAWFAAGQIPSHKVYLLWDLIGQLAWVKRKDSEGHLYETRHVWTTTRVVRLKDRTTLTQLDRLHHGQTAKIHIKTHTQSSPASCFWVSVSCASPWECDDLQAAARFSHLWVFVWRAVRRRYRAVCLMSFQVHHINIFVYANLEVHSCQPCRWMEE